MTQARKDGKAGPHLRWFDACFADPVEEATYRAATQDGTLFYARIALLLSLALFSLFGLVDVLYGGERRILLLLARVGICASFIGLLVLSFRPEARTPQKLVRLSQAIGISISIGFVLLVALAAQPLRDFYIPGILLVVVALFVLLRLSLFEILGVVLFLVALNDGIWWLFWLEGDRFGAFTVMQFYLFAALVVGIFSNYAIEHHRRVTYAGAGDLRAQAARLAAALDQAAAARLQAEHASRAKSDFIAHMSHELRTPLNAVIGFGQVLEGEVFGPIGNGKYREYARHIHESGQHLLSLINDILDLSKVEAGQLELHPEMLDLEETMRTATLLVSGLTAARRVRLRMEVPVAAPDFQADARAIKQILVNLLSNAVKFSPPGGEVLFSVAPQPDALVFTVADEGPGMNAAQVARALVPFGQASGHVTEATRGTGLGLPLALKLTEQHGGRLEIDSAPGRGTRVIVTLPQPLAMPAAGL